MIIAIDFDGTIVDNDFPKIGNLKPGAKETINSWYEKGHKIIIWSCRSEDDTINAAEDFLKENGIKYHTFNDNVYRDDGFEPHPKVFANLYIDDRGFRFTDEKYNWSYLQDKI